MTYIANILTKSKSGFCSLFNKTCSIHGLIDGIPTLIVGWEFTKEMYPDADILNWKINDNVYWTFGNRERRNVYEERLADFTSMAADRFSSSVRYEYINLLTADECEKKKILDMMDARDRTAYMIKNDIVYLYNGDGVVIGFSLRDIRYKNRKTDNVLHRISVNDANEKIDTDTIDNEILFRFKNRIYLMPVLYF